MKISRFSSALALLACLGALQANAQMLNISTQALQSQNTPGVACTIAAASGSSLDGAKAYIVVSEATSAGSNPRLIAQLLENGETMSNNNWMEPIYVNGSQAATLTPGAYAALLRTPAAPGDAAFLISVPLGWRMCAQSTEESGGDTFRRANLQITDVTDKLIAALRTSPDYSHQVKKYPAGTQGVAGTFLNLIANR